MNKSRFMEEQMAFALGAEVRRSIVTCLHIHMLVLRPPFLQQV